VNSYQAKANHGKALPYLVSFYTALNKVSDIPFDIDRAARLELELWIVHRERDKHATGDLAGALAALSSELYQMPAERFAEHARLRAEAMTRCDRSRLNEDRRTPAWILAIA
jgi:hypothetical protein